MVLLWRGDQENSFLRFSGKSGIKKFLLVFERVCSQKQTEVIKVDTLQRYLHGEAFDFFYDSFKANGTLTEDGKDYERVKKALLERFAKVEDPQDTVREATEAELLSKGLPGSLQRLNPLYAKAELKKRADFRILRAAVMKFPELAHFAKYQDDKDYLPLRKTV